MRNLFFTLIFSISIFNVATSANISTGEPLLKKLSSVNAEWIKHSEFTKNFTTTSFTENKTYNDWIVTHLMLVEKALRAKNISSLSASQKDKREKLLNALNSYWHKGYFPINDYTDYKTPVFIDRKGTHCAVGYLMQQSGYDNLAQKISVEQKFAYVLEIKVKGVKEWADKMGFTLDDLAWIQPTYLPSTNFIPVGTGTNKPVTCISSAYNELVLAGDFDTLNNLPCAHIGQYKSGQLSCIGGGLNGNVQNVFTDGGWLAAAGTFQLDTITCPLVLFNLTSFSAKWKAIDIPGRENALGTAAYINGNLVEVGLSDSSIPGKQEIWSTAGTGSWKKIATLNGTIYSIADYIYGRAYAGAFDSVVVYRDGLNDTLIITNNVLICAYSSSWYGLNGLVSDTIHSIKGIGNALYMAGSCSDSAKRSHVCLTRYLNNTLQPLLSTSDFYGSSNYTIESMSLYNTDNLVIGGDFTFYWNFGTVGNNLASYDLAQSELSILGDFDSTITSVGIVDSQLIIGGAFKQNFHNYWQNLSHLAKIDVVTSVNNITVSGKMQLYPNPASDLIHIQIPSDETILQTELSDITGRTIYMQNNIFASKDITVEQFPSGVYFVRMLTDKGWSTGRFVKD